MTVFEIISSILNLLLGSACVVTLATLKSVRAKAGAEAKEAEQEAKGKEIENEETMADLVASTNAGGLLKLMTASAGDVNLIAIARKPSAAYEAGEGFLDVDVEETVLASLPLCQAMQAKNTPLRLFIEGRVANEDAAINAFKPNEANNGFASVVLGGTSADGSGAVSLALARACKYEAHVKLGSGQNGALTIPQVYVGTKAMEERPDMETLHDQGFLTFMRRPGTAGYYFGVDNMCENADFSILVHGRVIDKAQRVASAAYQPYVEDYIRINPDGTLNAGDAKHLEDILDTAVRANMGGQISDVKAVIDTNQDVINMRTLKVSVSVLPLGYLTWINVTLGLTAQTTN